MAAYRETATGGVEIYAHRVKSLLLVAGLTVFATVGAVIAAIDPTSWVGWLCILFFGGLGATVVAKHLRSGVFTGKPALVLDPQGLHDRQSGLRVRWEEIERIEHRELTTRYATQHFLGLWVRDPEPVLRQLPRPVRLLARMQLAGWPPVSISLNLLGTTTDEVVGLVARFFPGEIAYDGEIDPTPERPSRGRRFARWAKETAIVLALGGAIAALLVWLDL